ncbi:MAG: tetratricopeptide repeat protein [Bacteroidota bacterium]
MSSAQLIKLLALGFISLLVISSTLRSQSLFVKALAEGGSQSDQLKEAIPLLQQTIRGNPRNVNAWKSLCEAYARNNQLDSAQVTAERSIRYFPNNRVLISFYAELFWNYDSYESAAKWFERLYRLEPSDVNKNFLVLSYRNAGAQEYKAKQWKKAASLFGRSLQHDSTQQDLYPALASALAQAKEYDKALRVVKEGLRRYPAKKELRHIQQYILIQKKDYRSLEIVYRDYLREHPEDLDAGLDLAQVYLTLGKGTEAQLQFQKLRKQFPGNPKVYRAEAEYWHNVLRFDKEREVYRELFRYHPDADTLSLKIAATFEEEKRWDSARASYKTFLEKHPYDLRALFSLASTYENESMFDSALTVYENILHDHPTNTRAAKRAGDAAKQINQKRKALAFYEHWAQLEPQSPEPFTAQGETWESLGDTAKAIQAYKTAEQYGGNSRSAHRLFTLYLRKPPLDGVARDRSVSRLEEARHYQVIALRRAVDEIAKKEKIIAATLSEDSAKGIANFQKASAAVESLREPRRIALDVAEHWIPNKLDSTLVQELTSLLREYPNAPLLTELLATIAMEKEDWVQARSLYERLLQTEPRSIKAHLSLGKIYEISGALKSALKLYEQAVELSLESEGDENSSSAFRATIRVAEKIDRLSTVAERWAQLHRIHKKHEVLKQNLIEVLHKLGRTDEARKLVDEKY